MKIKVESYSDRGCVRSKNQDHVLLVNEVFNDGMRKSTYNTEKPLFLAVADGMGGHKAGEVASCMVLNSLKDFSADTKLIDKSRSFDLLMKKWFDETDALVKEAGKVDQAKSGMGTTLAGIYIYQASAFVFNAGDSRVYYLDQGKPVRLTTDHSGISFPGYRSHMLTNCIGPTKKPFIDVADISHLMVKGVKFLISTDGLTDMLDDTEISAGLNYGQRHKLLEMAKERGGIDNISFIHVELE